MEQQKLSAWMWLTAALSVLVAFPVDANVVKQTAVLLKPTKAEVPITNIPQLSDIPLPKTSVKDWLAQDNRSHQVILVTGVRLSRTANGLEVILETPTSDQLQTTTINTEGKTFSAAIPNAQLRLPSGNSFRADNPVSGITSVTVTNQNAYSIQLKVTGSTGVPNIKAFDSAQGLIFSAIPTTATSQQPQPQKPSSQTPAKPSTQSLEPIELVVTGEPEGEYRVPNAPSITKTDVPLEDLPESIEVVPRQVLEDRQVTRLDEFTDNVSGVQRIFGFGTASGYIIRGFFTGYENLRNGFRDQGNPRDISNIERVEVLKGPSSVLYGGGSASNLTGAVNTVTKKPLENPFYQTNLTVGNYDFYRPTLDFTGPLNEDRSLLYRLNVAYENAGSYRDFVNDENFFIAPALTWKIDPRTTLSAEYEYFKYNYIFDKGFPLNPISLRLPVNRSFNEPNLNATTGTVNSVTLNFEHKFSEQWKFKQGFNTTISDLEVGNARLYTIDLASDGRTLNRTSTTGPQENENYTLQNELSGKFNTGPLRHNVLLGLELARYKYGYYDYQAPLAPIDIFKPIYGAKPGQSSLSFAGEQGADNLGVYLQDLIEVLPNLKIQAGGRFDVVDSFNKDLQTSRIVNEQTDRRFSPRVGIVYQPIKPTSLYFNWTNSFLPQIYSKSRTGTQFKPEIGEQFEAGIKQDFLDNRLSATLAFYQITVQNVLTPDPVDNNFSIQTGEQRSRGVELDLVGQILPGWKVIATYAHTDAVVTKDNQIPVGNRQTGVPEDSASLWTTYQLQNSNLKGLQFGLGLVYAAKREVSLPNTFTVPSYLRTDASVSYRRNHYKVGLNFKNLFNVKYYEVDGYSLLPAAPMTVLGTLSVEF